MSLKLLVVSIVHYFFLLMRDWIQTGRYEFNNIRIGIKEDKSDYFIQIVKDNAISAVLFGEVSGKRLCVRNTDIDIGIAELKHIYNSAISELMKGEM